MTKFANSETDAISSNWQNLDQDSRISTVIEALEGSRFSQMFTVSRALESGAVYVTALRPLGPNIRGSTLLDLEAYLKERVEKGISLWCEPIGDRNSLRNLRGVQIINQGT